MISPLNCKGWGMVSAGMMVVDVMVMAQVVADGDSEVSKGDGHPYIRFKGATSAFEERLHGQILPEEI